MIFFVIPNEVRNPYGYADSPYVVRVGIPLSTSPKGRERLRSE